MLIFMYFCTNTMFTGSVSHHRAPAAIVNNCHARSRRRSHR